MSVATTALGRGTFSKHLLAREHKSKGGKKNLLIGLSLTSMVDMFSLLVIFLLQTFSTSPEMLVIAKGVTLPTAATGLEIKDAPLLAISNEEIFLDQKRVGKTSDLLKNPAPLMEKLADLRKLWIKAHPGEGFRGEVNLQAHRELSATMISQFMSMLSSQHYSSIQLAVIGGGTGGSSP